MCVGLALFLISMIAIRVVAGYPRANQVYPWLSAPLFGLTIVCAILSIVEVQKREASPVDFWLISLTVFPLCMIMILNA